MQAEDPCCWPERRWWEYCTPSTTWPVDALLQTECGWPSEPVLGWWLPEHPAALVLRLLRKSLLVLPLGKGIRGGSWVCLPKEDRGAQRQGPPLRPSVQQLKWGSTSVPP